MQQGIEIQRKNEDFENEVRRIARLLWPDAKGSGAQILEGYERDGVFETEECFHVIEATTSRRKQYVQDKAGKLKKLTDSYQKRNAAKAVKGWLITCDEPTADQRSVIDKYKPIINILSFAHFQSKLIDARSYLSARNNYYFGSVSDPSSGDKTPKIKYIDGLLSRNGMPSVTTGELLKQLIDGGRVVILGDFGAGKSMTMRDIFQKLHQRHCYCHDPKFPVFINLRDHMGQNDPGEVLHRHARIVGFDNPEHLVRAWRAGYVHLLLDGFDEISSIAVQGIWKKLKDHRHRAVTVIRKFVQQTPKEAGLAISGRAHFFNSDNERNTALDLSESFVEYTLNEFNDEQIAFYLQQNGLSGSFPAWLPSRPLLVAYLAAQEILSDLCDGMFADYGGGWDFVLTKIAEREALIDAGIDGGTVRKILERIATKARSSAGGLGPISSDDLINSFFEVCGYKPDHGAMVLLQRLPGLGVERDEEDTRSFIDEDLVDACRAGDLIDFIKRPYDFELDVLRAIECTIGAIGIAVAAHYRGEISMGQIRSAIRYAKDEKGAISHNVFMDIIELAIHCGFNVESNLCITGVYLKELELSAGMPDIHNVTFQGCFFGRIGIDADVEESLLPKFRECFTSELDGRTSRQDLPVDLFDDKCIIESYTSTFCTNDAVLSLPIPLGIRVLLTVLRKLYQQRGSGRKESALLRGLDHHAKRMVPSILQLLQREGIASSYRSSDYVVWIPDRRKMQRVGRIIAAPNSSDDSLLRATAAL